MNWVCKEKLMIEMLSHLKIYSSYSSCSYSHIRTCLIGLLFHAYQTSSLIHMKVLLSEQASIYSLDRYGCTKNQVEKYGLLPNPPQTHPPPTVLATVAGIFPAKKFSPYFSFRNMTTHEWNKFYSWIQLFDNGLLLPEILALWATFKAVLRAVDMLEFSRSFMVFDHQRPPPQYGKKIHSHLICLCTLP